MNRHPLRLFMSVLLLSSIPSLALAGTNVEDLAYRIKRGKTADRKEALTVEFRSLADSQLHALKPKSQQVLWKALMKCLKHKDSELVMASCEGLMRLAIASVSLTEQKHSFQSKSKTAKDISKVINTALDHLEKVPAKSKQLMLTPLIFYAWSKLPLGKAHGRTMKTLVSLIKKFPPEQEGRRICEALAWQKADLGLLFKEVVPLADKYKTVAVVVTETSPQNKTHYSQFLAKGQPAARLAIVLNVGYQGKNRAPMLELYMEHYRRLSKARKKSELRERLQTLNWLRGLSSVCKAVEFPKELIPFLEKKEGDLKELGDLLLVYAHLTKDTSVAFPLIESFFKLDDGDIRSMAYRAIASYGKAAKPMIPKLKERQTKEFKHSRIMELERIIKKLEGL